jgi:predicted dehydrogenase
MDCSGDCVSGLAAIPCGKPSSHVKERFMLNIGIVGCGKIADGHAEEIRKIACARLIAVCDIEPILATRLATRHGVPHCYTDFDRMLSEQRLDVLHIATPPQSHLALAQKSVAAGCHLFLEKPLAPNLEDARRLMDAARRAERKLTINYWNNFEAPALAFKEFVANGKLGEPVHIESYYGYDLSEGFGQALLSDTRHWVHGLPGKLFQNVIDHVINKVVPFLPAAPEVIARAYRRRQLNNNDRTDEVLDELRVMMIADRMSAYLTFCSHARPSGHLLRVYGTRNTVNVDYRLRTMLIEESQTVPTALGRLLPPFKSGWQSLRQATHNVGEFAATRFHFFAGLNRLLTLFYKSILEDSPPPIPYSEILRVSEIMDEILAQVYPGILV